MAAATNGQGIALVPWLLAEADVAGGKLTEIWRDRHSDLNGFHLISPVLTKAKPAVRTMIEWCKSEVGNPDPRKVESPADQAE